MKHAGRFKGANAVAQKKSANCEIVEFFLFVDDSGQIKKASFKAFGSPVVVACCSALIDLVLGSRIGEAVDIKPKQILHILEDFEFNYEHIATFVTDAFLETIKNYFVRQKKLNRA
jgi:NifU-like protein involved in Fe-S cluster formation